MDSPSAAVSSEIYEQEVDCVEIPKRVWQSNEFDKYMPQDPQDNYQGYEPDEYGSEFNSEKETVPTSSNYYSESSISKQEKYSNHKKKEQQYHFQFHILSYENSLPILFIIVI